MVWVGDGHHDERRVGEVADMSLLSSSLERAFPLDLFSLLPVLDTVLLFLPGGKAKVSSILFKITQSS